MSTIIKPIQIWLNTHPNLKQWAWFAGLWLVGLVTALVLSYPIKLVIWLMS